ncbi:MAG: hypothetical protein WBA63_13260 [Thermomicrobiales bacterium]
MKFLLTSAGIRNPSIHDALLEMLGKPIAECSALCIPTANHAQRSGAHNAWRFTCGLEPETPMVELGWKSMDVLDLGNSDLPHNTMTNAEKWAADMPVSAYAIDDETAISMTGDAVDVVSEGHWRLFTP